MGLFSRNRGVGDDLFAPMPVMKTHDGSAKSAISLDDFKRVAPELESRYEGAKISLEKKRAIGMRAAVYLVVDRSGSMSSFYSNGSVQTFAERILAAAAHFDDDGVVPVMFFGSDVHPTQSITLSHYQNRVRDLHQQLGGMGTTNYAAAMRAVIRHYRESGADVPALVIFQSDGAPNSRAEAEQIVRDSAHLPIFWQFVGFGRDEFEFLKKLDELRGRKVDNAGFFEAGVNPSAMTDGELYDNLLGEYPQWVEAARRAGIVA